MIQRTEARQLSSKNEWSLISSSLPPALATLTVARLKSKISRAGTLRGKYQDLYRRQKLAAKSRMTGTPGEKLNARTWRKKTMFDEAIARLRLQLRKTSATKLPENRRRQSFMDRATSPALPKTARRTVTGYQRRHSHVAASTRRRQSKRDSMNRH